MLHEPDDVQIRLVAQGLVSLMGREAAVAELGRLYGRERAIQALRRSTLADRYGDRVEDVEIVIDLTTADLTAESTQAEAQPESPAEPMTIDLRDDVEPSAVPRRAAAVYGQPVAPASRQLAQAGRTYWL